MERGSRCLLHQTGGRQLEGLFPCWFLLLCSGSAESFIQQAHPPFKREQPQGSRLSLGLLISAQAVVSGTGDQPCYCALCSVGSLLILPHPHPWLMLFLSLSNIYLHTCIQTSYIRTKGTAPFAVPAAFLFCTMRIPPT